MNNYISMLEHEFLLKNSRNALDTIACSFFVYFSKKMHYFIDDFPFLLETAFYVNTFYRVSPVEIVPNFVSANFMPVEISKCLHSCYGFQVM